jgi:chromosome segregation ATPase
MIRKSIRGLRALALAGLALACQAALAEELFYRYENTDGVTVIDDHVPPDLAYKGYTVLSRTGRVIEVVPRALSEAERNDPNGQAVRLRLEAEDRARQKRFDQALLTRYSTVADIEDAKLRKVNEVKVRINMLKGNIAALRQQLESLQQDAAGYEREGQAVPADLPKTIESLRAEIAKSEAQIGRHDVELKATELRYDMEIQRFRTLRPELAPAVPAPGA